MRLTIATPKTPSGKQYCQNCGKPFKPAVIGQANCMKCPEPKAEQ